MHDNPQSCALDVKPSGVISSSGGNKQREGSEYEGGGGMFNGNFDGTYGGAAAYAHGIHGSAYSPQAKAHLGSQGAQSPNKPRNKSRTSAGKIILTSRLMRWLINLL